MKNKSPISTRPVKIYIQKGSDSSVRLSELKTAAFESMAVLKLFFVFLEIFPSFWYDWLE